MEPAEVLEITGDRLGPAPTLTLWQPWASLIVRGLKTIETRRHNYFRAKLKGRRFYIHAGKKYARGCEIEISEYLMDSEQGFGMNEAEVEAVFEAARGECGHVLGSARCVDVHGMGPDDEWKALVFWDHKLWSYVLDDIIRIDKPIPAKGQQGVWRWDLRARSTVR